MNQHHCPFCKVLAAQGCEHLALAVEAREFVRRCIDRCEAQQAWRILCQQRQQQSLVGGWARDHQDFTWLETAFCQEFLRPLTWFGGMEHEWRSGPRPEQGGFWVLLWSKDPRRLWWELRDELEREGACTQRPPDAPTWQIWQSPR